MDMSFGCAQQGTECCRHDASARRCGAAHQHGQRPRFAAHLAAPRDLTIELNFCRLASLVVCRPCCLHVRGTMMAPECRLCHQPNTRRWLAYWLPNFCASLSPAWPASIGAKCTVSLTPTQAASRAAPVADSFFCITAYKANLCIGPHPAPAAVLLPHGLPPRPGQGRPHTHTQAAV